MRERHATKELDRVSGLASISFPQSLPIYDPKQSNEDAWEILVKVISGLSRAHLFFWYPMAGNTQYLWLPSWSQVMAGDTPAADRNLEAISMIYYNEAQGGFCGMFIVLDDCVVHGLALPSLGISSERSVVRNGSITLGSQDTEGPQQHSVMAYHQVMIDETIHYTLLSPANTDFSMIYKDPTIGQCFVIGVRNDIGQYKKLCVLDFVTPETYSVIKRIGSYEIVVLI